MSRIARALMESLIVFRYDTTSFKVSASVERNANTAERF
jgi:hypothetical protein